MKAQGKNLEQGGFLPFGQELVPDVAIQKVPEIVDSEIPEKEHYTDYSSEEREELARIIREVRKHNNKNPSEKKKLSEKLERFEKLNQEFWDESDERYR